MACVNYRKVSKNYDNHSTAVNNFNLEVKDHEFLVLVGPSGCGKTTTLRMTAGLEKISSGELYIGDRLVNEVPAKDRDIAMVFQNYALYPQMSVYENIAFSLKLRKNSKQEIAKRVNEVAEMLDITKLLERKPKTLSGGQRQRVALGRAIVRKPKVFLMDEPLSNIDAKLRLQMRTEISKLQKKLGTTTIYVTHDQTEAMTMGDRIVVMRNGIIQQTDSPLNMYNAPANLFVAGFIGSPVMNFFDGELTVIDGKNYFQNAFIKIGIPNAMITGLTDRGEACRKVALGIRPENVQVDSNLEEDAVAIGTIELVEHLGSDKYLYIEGIGKQLIARVGKNANFNRGDRVQVLFGTDAAHLFDKETGINLLKQ